MVHDVYQPSIYYQCVWKSAKKNNNTLRTTADNKTTNSQRKTTTAKNYTKNDVKIITTKRKRSTLILIIGFRIIHRLNSIHTHFFFKSSDSLGYSTVAYLIHCVYVCVSFFLLLKTKRFYKLDNNEKGRNNNALDSNEHSAHRFVIWLTLFFFSVFYWIEYIFFFVHVV